MTTVAAALLVLLFFALAHLLGVPARAGRVIARSRQAVATLRDPDLSELEKEQAIQATAKHLFGQFAVITAAAAVALAVPAGALALLDLAGVCELDAVLDATLSWPFLIGATVVGCAAYPLLRARSP